MAQRNTLQKKDLPMRCVLICLLFIGFPTISQAQDRDWFAEGRQILDQRSRLLPIEGPAKNVILFVGDGMGITTVTAGRIYDGQTRGQTGEENNLAFDLFPHTALIKTYNTNAQVADSAGTATAMLSGVKTKIGMIGVDDKVVPADCGTLDDARIPTLLELAETVGLRTGIVTTTRVTHATPASAYAHIPQRNWESAVPDGQDCADIALQLLQFDHGDGIELVMGGGRANFLPDDETGPEDAKGRRQDGRNLIREWQAKHADGAYVWDQAGFADLNPQASGPVLALFNPSHMEYELDRAEDQGGEPSLAEMVRFALTKLDNDQGYFLLVEAGRIDHAHHGTNAARALADTQALSQAVETALVMTDHAETLILVTADHSHAFTIAGYPSRGNPILGLADQAGYGVGTPRKAEDGKPYTTLGYANGGSAIDGERGTLTAEEVADHDHRQQATVPLRSETHGGEDVALYAMGPMAYLVGGVWEQNVIFHLMDRALGGLSAQICGGEKRGQGPC